jgi:predicted nuclease with TOPRIM domain
MDTTNWAVTLLSNPYISGLLVGIIFFLYVRSLMKIRQQGKDIKKLRDHMHTKFEIESTDNERRKAEFEKIKQERDNLRNMTQVLNQKPGRQELRQAHIYQKAVEIMFEKSPGFAPAWQITLKEAEEEMQNSEKGIIPFFKRMASTAGTSTGDHDRSKKKTLELDEPVGS